MRKVDPEYFYRSNTKSNTAGYDKWVYVGLLAGKAMYRNKRTNSTRLFPVVAENGVLKIPDKRFYPVCENFEVLFRTPVDYFRYIREKGYHQKDASQFIKEEEQLKKKYPEHFI
jgi:hypothetical protein